MTSRESGPSADGELLLRISGRLDLHPWIESAGPATAEDAYSVCRARTALMGWDTTFSTMPGDRQELFALLDAQLAAQGTGDLGRFRVQPTQPAAVHRYLPTLGVAVQDTIARLGVAHVTGIMIDVPAASYDSQSLPYLLETCNWFRGAAPGEGRSAAMTCEGPSEAHKRKGLDHLARLAIAPFALDREHERLRLPEWNVLSATWALATLTSAMRAADFADNLRVELRPV